MHNQYVIKFTGKISWEGQGNGLPPEIYAYIIVEGEGDKSEREFINQVIEQQSSGFIKAQSMVVQKNQGQIIDLRQTPADRMLVPFRWIVSLSVSVHKLGAELSEADEDGKERFADGTEPLKQ